MNWIIKIINVTHLINDSENINATPDIILKDSKETQTTIYS
jgi:hypothetical protein